MASYNYGARSRYLTRPQLSGDNVTENMQEWIEENEQIFKFAVVPGLTIGALFLLQRMLKKRKRRK